MVTPLRSGQDHMSVGGSAKSAVTSSHNSAFRPLGDDREFLSEFSTHQLPNVFLTEG